MNVPDRDTDTVGRRRAPTGHAGALLGLCALHAGCHAIPWTPAAPPGRAGTGESGKGPPERLLEELFLLENPALQERGEWQVTGAVSRRAEDRSSFGTNVEYGLTDRVQVEVGVETADPADVDENDETTRFEAGALFGLTRTEGTLLSLSVEIGLETGEEGGEDELELETAVLYSAAFDRLELFANAGFELSDEPGAVCGVGIARAFGELTFTGELLGGRIDEDESLAAALGALWHPVEGLELGLGYPVSLSPGPAEGTLLLMLTAEF